MPSSTPRRNHTQPLSTELLLQVNLVIQTEEGDLSNYVTNGEWDLIDMIVERNVVYYSCCEEPYPDITYHIILRRRPLFYGQEWEIVKYGLCVPRVLAGLVGRTEILCSY